MEFQDQMGNTIRLSAYPQRIISLVPSLTELLFDLGLDDEVVGVTTYCILPEDKIRNLTRIGGPKEFEFTATDKLKPDLIIGNKEENYREGILRLQEKYLVWMSDIITIDDALMMIRRVGTLINRSQNAERLAGELSASLGNKEFYPLYKVAYVIWKDPYMVAAGNTFINEMLRKCGFINIFENKSRYPQITINELDQADVVLLSSEPYPFADSDVNDLKNQNPSISVILVDGKIFSWYGSRLRYAAGYFTGLRKSIQNAKY